MPSIKETEIPFYAMVTNRAGFEQAIDTEAQEQWTYLILDSEGKESGSHVRVRKTLRDGKVVFEETIKTKTYTAGVQDSIESTSVIDEDYYKAWIKAFPCKGVIKTRYVFLSKEVLLEKEGEKIVLPEVKYEVDILMDIDSNPSKWCKVDIEIDNILAYLAEHHTDISKFDLKVALSTLPIDLKEAFCGINMTEDQKAGVEAFWNKFSQLRPGDSEPAPQPAPTDTPPVDTPPVEPPPDDDTANPENKDGDAA